MKLINCNVYSFGALKNTRFNFTDGLNTIKENNGYGKSTLTVFIKSMFYGLNDSKRNIEENERLKFRPWRSTENFGGSIDFEWGNKVFRIERFFGSKSAEDTISLKDLETGRIYSNIDDLGKRIFSIDEDGFLSTTYFAQKDFDIKSNSSITAKFNTICGESLNSEAYDLATQRLENKIKNYKMRGDKGLIADKKREIFSIEEQINFANKASEKASIYKEQLDELSLKLVDIKNQTKVISDKILALGKVEADAVKRERIDELESKRDVLIARKNKISNEYKGKFPTTQEIDTYKQCFNELNKAKNKEDLLAEKLNQQQISKPSNVNTTYLSLAVLFSVVLIVGIILSFFILYAGVALLCVSIVLAGAFIVLWKTRNKNYKKKIEELNALKNEYDDYRLFREKYQQKLDEFFIRSSKVCGDYVFRFSAIINEIDEYNKILDELKVIHSKIDTLKRDISSSNEKLNMENLDVLKNKLDSLQQNYSILSKEFANKQSLKNIANDTANNLPELQSKLADCKAELIKLNEEYEIYSLTLKYLKKADENLKIKYRQPLENSLNKYFALISNDKMKTISIDVDLKVSVNDQGGVFDTAYYSKGYRNLFEICKRFALTDVLFTSEKPFMILDDPFYNLDDEKLKEAIFLIKKLSNDYQILYFVCHESRRA